jgi:hypothetical protein
LKWDKTLNIKKYRKGEKTMKKIVIATMLTLMLVSMVATTVFAGPPVPNPKANENACFGQAICESAIDPGLWWGTETPGEFVSGEATNDYGNGVSTELQDWRCEFDCHCKTQSE